MTKEVDILAIDDEEVILEAIKKVAELEGLTITGCLNASDALLNISRNNYRIIISDIMMPEIDGFELIRILKSKRIDIPVIITTGFSTMENAVKSLYEGAISFVPKPFSVDELTSIIKRGLVYARFFHEKLNTKKTNQISEFVSCPPKYFRLGYDSWMNKIEEGLVQVGVTDLFLKSISFVKQIEFINTGENIYQGGNCLKIIDDENATHHVLAPISGRIIDLNEKVIVNKSLLEKDPYFNGWIYRVIPNNLQNELENITPCSSDF